MEDRELDQQTQGGNEKENASKDKKKFQEGFNKLMAMLNGDISLFKNKIKGKGISMLIAKLTEERQKKVEADFINAASALIDKKVQFDKDIRQKKDEFEKAIAAKEKEFLQEMNKVFGMIDDFGEVQKAYAATLRELAPEENNANPPA